MHLQREMLRSTLAGTHTEHLTTNVDVDTLPPEVEPVNLHDRIRQTDAHMRELIETGAWPSVAARMVMREGAAMDLSFEDLVNVGERHWVELFGSPGRVRSSSCRDKIEPLNVISAHSLVSTTPPPRRFIIDNFISEDIAGIVAAPGGLSKSFFLLSMGVHLATGRSFFGNRIHKPRGVLVCSAEDDVGEVHRRIHAIKVAVEDGDEPIESTDLFRLGIVDMVGDTEQIITMEGNNPVINMIAVERIIEAAKTLPDVGLIILDPAARFRSGGENDTPAATAFVKALEVIRREAGASVLVAHHARKGSTGDTADDIRGSSALVDAARWAATMAHIPEKSVGKYGLDEIERRSLIRFRVVKSNYTHPQGDLWLRRCEGGALRLTDAPITAKSARDAVQDEGDYRKFIEGMNGLLREQGPMAERALRSYFGVEKVLGCGRCKAERFIARGLREDTLQKNGEGKFIPPPMLAPSVG